MIRTLTLFIFAAFAALAPLYSRASQPRSYFDLTAGSAFFTEIGDVAVNNLGDAVWLGITADDSEGIFGNFGNGVFSVVSDSNGWTDFDKTPDINNNGGVLWGARRNGVEEVRLTNNSGGQHSLILDTSGPLTDLRPRADLSDSSIIYGGAITGNGQIVWKNESSLTSTVVSTQSSNHQQIFGPVSSSGGLWSSYRTRDDDGTQNIYVNRNGVETRVIGTNDGFASVNVSSVNNRGDAAGLGITTTGDHVLFWGDGRTIEGVIADSTQYRGFGSEGVGFNDDRESVFLAELSSGKTAIVTGAGERLVEVGQTIPGRGVIQSLDFHPRGFSGDMVAFKARFQDDSLGVFRTSLAPLSEPYLLELTAPFYAEYSHTLTNGPGDGMHVGPKFQFNFDLAGGGKVPLIADGDGVARFRDKSLTGGAGNVVTNDHGQSPIHPKDTSKRIFSAYIHVDDETKKFFQNGTVNVKRGDLIAIEGDTGEFAQGIHLDYGVYLGDPNDSSTWISIGLDDPFDNVDGGNGDAPDLATLWLGLADPSGEIVFGRKSTRDFDRDDRPIFYSDRERPASESVSGRIDADQILDRLVFADGRSNLNVMLESIDPLGLRISDPMGAIYGIFFGHDEDIEITIPNAMSGLWQLEVMSENLPPSGGEYTLTYATSTVPEAPAYALSGLFCVLFCFLLRKRSISFRFGA